MTLLCLSLYLSGAWMLPLVDRDEPRFAEASREMLQRHDLVIPWFNGGYRFDKPPLIYWCQMASFRMFGENPFAARLPAALFATATTLAVLGWGRRLTGPKAGWQAAIILATCVQMLIHGRLSVADLPMVFFVTLAIWSGWEMTRPGASRPRLWWGVFHLSLGLGFLAKGPVAWLPLAGVLIGRWRRPDDFKISGPALGLGMMLTLLVVALWGVPALILTHGEFIRIGLGKHVISRSISALEGHGASGWQALALLPFFGLTFFASFLPWAFRVPGALRQWWVSDRADSAGWYLLLQSALFFAVFTAVQTKLPHYTLPAFPCLALWLARQSSRGAIPELPVHKWALGMTALTLILSTAGFAALTPLFAAHQLFESARPRLRPEMKCASVGYDEPSLVWEFRAVVTNVVQSATPEQATRLLLEGGPMVVVVPTGFYQTNRAFAAAATNTFTTRVRTWNPVKLKRLDLTAVIRE